MGLLPRLAAVVFLPVVLCAGGPENWVPARWPGGPLEAAGRDWYNPRTLDLLRDTPINCLLVTWSSGADAAAEAEQQKLVAAYARAARERGIAVLGVLRPGADPARAAAAALDAGLDGVVLEGGPATTPEISLPGKAVGPVLRTDAVAPRVRAVSESDSVTATPTTEPWIDSNIWLVRALRPAAGARPVWLGYRLEKASPADYVRAIADAAIAGGRWVVALDDELAAGLLHGHPQAGATWRRISDCLKFFEQHAGWRDLEPVAALGIVRDRDGRHPEMSDENLNLITRRRIPFRVIERAELSGAALAGLPAVLAADLAPPTEAERRMLGAFAEKGGLLVAGPSWTSAGPGGTDYALQRLGAGRVAVYKTDPPDPETLSKDLLDLIGNDRLPVRLFNVSSVLAQAAADRGAARLVVQLVNYATAPADRITIRAEGDYRTARLFSLDAPPADLKVTRTGSRVEVRIEKVAVYAAAMLEK